MKNLIGFLILFTGPHIFSQSFHRNGLVVDAGGGIEIYNTKLKVSNHVTGRDTTTEDKAGNIHFYLATEYGITKNFGAGLVFRSDKYFVDKDTSGKTNPTVVGTEFVLQLNYHPVVRKGIDLVVGGDFGYSRLNLNGMDTTNTNVWGKGMFYSVYVNPRFYFHRFGFNFKIYAPFFTYPKLQSNNPNFTKDQSYKMGGIPGWGFSLGLQYCFFNEKGVRGERRRK